MLRKCSYKNCEMNKISILFYVVYIFLNYFRSSGSVIREYEIFFNEVWNWKCIWFCGGWGIRSVGSFFWKI